MLIFRTKYNFCRLPILDCLELKDYVSLIDLTRHKTAIVEKIVNSVNQMTGKLEIFFSSLCLLVDTNMTTMHLFLKRFSAL